MPFFTPILPETAQELGSNFDRTLTFEQPNEFWLIQLAANSRVKYRKARGEEAESVDVQMAEMDPQATECLHTAKDWPAFCLDLLNFYWEEGYDQIPLADKAEVLATRDKVKAYMAELSIAHEVFEGIKEIENFLKLEAAGGAGLQT